MSTQEVKETWDDLDYWRSGEWQVVQEKLDDEEKDKHQVCPERQYLFAALDQTPLRSVRVVIMGQDPYPDGTSATGVAFAIPMGVSRFPASLCNIYREYCDDLHYPYPSTGDLSRWTKQGVLLWNAYPSCRKGSAGSHHWNEWDNLTREIVETLDEQNQPVFCLLGGCARSFGRSIKRSHIVETSHPSPLGAKYGFLGSRIFSTINTHLPNNPINWRLP
jgi:uracil-DNA glycosylase